MTSKSVIRACLAICITAILAVAVCGCDDLGAYSDTSEYYSSFGDISLINGTTREEKSYSVEDYFYSEDSRERFLEGEDGAYNGVAHADYVYVAIPFEKTIDMDSLALYMQSISGVTVYISFFVTDEIPSEWKSLADFEETKDLSEGETPPEYDDPAPETSIGEVIVRLENENWGSFVLDSFNVGGKAQQSIQINKDQYLLLQIRNNSGLREWDETAQAYVDPQSGLELQKAEITMTNLLIRALDVQG